MNKAQAYDEVTARREVMTLYGRVLLDGSSVPIPFAAATPSTTSDSPKLCRFVMTRTGVGVYVITLQDKFTKLLSVKIHVQVAAVAATAGREFFVSADAVASTPSLTVTFVRTDTGAAADPTVSATLLVEVTLGNSE